MTEVDKRRKNDALVSFDMEFTDEQKVARRICHDNTVTIITGKAGTAKTTIAASVALELLMRKPKYEHTDPRRVGKYTQVVISRPTVVVGKNIGFMPGDMVEKLDPYISPVIDVMEKLIGKERVTSLVDKDAIKVVPIQFMRGRTFDNSIIILDEGQNANFNDFKAISSRLGRMSKLLVTSDWRQIDLKDRNESVAGLFEIIKDLDGVDMVELEENFRHPLAIEIMDKINEVESMYF